MGFCMMKSFTSKNNSTSFYEEEVEAPREVACPRIPCDLITDTFMSPNIS